MHQDVPRNQTAAWNLVARLPRLAVALTQGVVTVGAEAVPPAIPKKTAKSLLT